MKVIGVVAFLVSSPHSSVQSRLGDCLLFSIPHAAVIVAVVIKEQGAGELDAGWVPASGASAAMLLQRGG